jgi:hypothetical protein
MTITKGFGGLYRDEAVSHGVLDLMMIGIGSSALLRSS